MDGGLAIVVGAAIAAVPGIAAYLQSRKNTAKLVDVHTDLNSRLSQLIAATLQAGRLMERNEVAAAAAIVAHDGGVQKRQTP
jgi:hypothetical protein